MRNQLYKRICCTQHWSLCLPTFSTVMIPFSRLLDMIKRHKNYSCANFELRLTDLSSWALCLLESAFQIQFKYVWDLSLSIQGSSCFVFVHKINLTLAIIRGSFLFVYSHLHTPFNADLYIPLSPFEQWKCIWNMLSLTVYYTSVF